MILEDCVILKATMIYLPTQLSMLD